MQITFFTGIGKNCENYLKKKKKKHQIAQVTLEKKYAT